MAKLILQFFVFQSIQSAGYSLNCSPGTDSQQHIIKYIHKESVVYTVNVYNTVLYLIKC